MSNFMRYEIQARAFNIMTGHMAPGKDSSAVASDIYYKERAEAWRLWKKDNGRCISAMLAAFDQLASE